MKRTVLLTVVLGLLAPASAAAEPAGAPFLFNAEPVAELSLSAASPGRVLAAGANGTRGLLGREGRLAETERFYGPAVYGDAAANPRLGQHLRVWAEYGGILGQLVNADGAPLADPVFVHSRRSYLDHSDEPAVTYNARSREYLVAWRASDDAPTNAISVKRLDEQGRPVSAPTRVLFGYSVSHPDVAALPGDGGYLLVAQRFEPADVRPIPGHVVVGRRLGLAGAAAGADAFPITEHVNLVGTLENVSPALGADAASGEALVVWSDGYEIFARRVGSTGALLGRELRVSYMGPPGDSAWRTWDPAVAYSPRAGQYLVVWQSGGEHPDAYPGGEWIYGQHMTRDGREVGTPDFAVSGTDRSTYPAVAAFTDASDFLVGWAGDGGEQAWARRVTAAAPARRSAVPPRPW